MNDIPQLFYLFQFTLLILYFSEIGFLVYCIILGKTNTVCMQLRNTKIKTSLFQVVMAEYSKNISSLIEALSVDQNIDTIRALLDDGLVNSQSISIQDSAKVFQNAYNDEIVNLLVRYGFKINAKDDCEITPLLKAAMDGKCIKVINAILNNGGDQKILLTQNKSKKGAITYANSENFVNMFMYYLNYPNDDYIKYVSDELARFFVEYYSLMKNFVVEGGEEPFIFKQVMLALFRHVLILKGFDLYDYYELTLLCINSRFDHSGMITDLIDIIRCLRSEYDELKSHFISDSLTLHDFCMHNYYNIRIPIENSKVFNFVFDDSVNPSLESRYPLYYKVILMHKHIEKNRRNIVKLLPKITIFSNNKVRSNGKVNLNYDCLYYISNFLSYRDIVHLFLSSFRLL